MVNHGQASLQLGTNSHWMGIPRHSPFSDTATPTGPRPCEIVANASEVDPKTVAKPLYPKQFTVKRKDGKQGGYSDTLIGTLVQLISAWTREMEQMRMVGH